MNITTSIQHPSRVSQFLATRRDPTLVVMAAASVAATAGANHLLGITLSWWGFLLGLVIARSLYAGFHTPTWAAVGCALTGSALAAALGADSTWIATLVALTLWGYQRR